MLSAILPRGLGKRGQVLGLTGKHNVRLVLGFYEQALHIVTRDHRNQDHKGP